MLQTSIAQRQMKAKILLDIFEMFLEWKLDARDVAEIRQHFHFL